MQELVESEREYPLCHQRGLCFFFLLLLSSSLHALVLSITFHLATAGMSGVSALLSSLSQRSPTWPVSCGASLGVCVCGLQRRVQLWM